MLFPLLDKASLLDIALPHTNPNQGTVRQFISIINPMSQRRITIHQVLSLPLGKTFSQDIASLRTTPSQQAVCQFIFVISPIFQWCITIRYMLSLLLGKTFSQDTVSLHTTPSQRAVCQFIFVISPKFHRWVTIHHNLCHQSKLHFLIIQRLHITMTLTNHSLSLSPLSHSNLIFQTSTIFRAPQYKLLLMPN